MQGFDRVYLNDNARMPVPPWGFLQALHDYDADLVLFPSRQKAFNYVIARRMHNGRWAQKDIDHQTQPDTKLCMQHQLRPVCYMMQMGSTWNAGAILAKLKARDLWAHGGGEKAADLLEAQEAAEKAATLGGIREKFYHESGEAWRSYQQRTGQRVTNPGPARSGAALSSSSSRTVPGPIVLTDAAV